MNIRISITVGDTSSTGLSQYYNLNNNDGLDVSRLMFYEADIPLQGITRFTVYVISESLSAAEGLGVDARFATVFPSADEDICFDESALGFNCADHSASDIISIVRDGVSLAAFVKTDPHNPDQNHPALQEAIARASRGGLANVHIIISAATIVDYSVVKYNAPEVSITDLNLRGLSQFLFLTRIIESQSYSGGDGGSAGELVIQGSSDRIANLVFDRVSGDLTLTVLREGALDPVIFKTSFLALVEDVHEIRSKFEEFNEDFEEINTFLERFNDRVDQRIAGWAQSGNLDPIPVGKLSNVAGGDLAVERLTEDWALKENADEPIPLPKLSHAVSDEDHIKLNALYLDNTLTSVLDWDGFGASDVLKNTTGWIEAEVNSADIAVAGSETYLPSIWGTPWKYAFEGSEITNQLTMARLLVYQLNTATEVCSYARYVGPTNKIKFYYKTTSLGSQSDFEEYSNCGVGSRALDETRGARAITDIIILDNSILSALNWSTLSGYAKHYRLANNIATDITNDAIFSNIKDELLVKVRMTDHYSIKVNFKALQGITADLVVDVGVHGDDIETNIADISDLQDQIDAFDPSDPGEETAIAELLDKELIGFYNPGGDIAEEGHYVKLWEQRLGFMGQFQSVDGHAIRGTDDKVVTYSVGNDTFPAGIGFKNAEDEEDRRRIILYVALPANRIEDADIPLSIEFRYIGDDDNITYTQVDTRVNVPITLADGTETTGMAISFGNAITEDAAILDRLKVLRGFNRIDFKGTSRDNVGSTSVTPNLEIEDDSRYTQLSGRSKTIINDFIRLDGIWRLITRERQIVTGQVDPREMTQHDEPQPQPASIHSTSESGALGIAGTAGITQIDTARINDLPVLPFRAQIDGVDVVGASLTTISGGLFAHSTGVTSGNQLPRTIAIQTTSGTYNAVYQRVALSAALHVDGTSHTVQGALYTAVNLVAGEEIIGLSSQGGLVAFSLRIDNPIINPEIIKEEGTIYKQLDANEMDLVAEWLRIRGEWIKTFDPSEKPIITGTRDPRASITRVVTQGTGSISSQSSHNLAFLASISDITSAGAGRRAVTNSRTNINVNIDGESVVGALEFINENGRAYLYLPNNTIAEQFPTSITFEFGSSTLTMSPSSGTTGSSLLVSQTLGSISMEFITYSPSPNIAFPANTTFSITDITLGSSGSPAIISSLQTETVTETIDQPELEARTGTVYKRLDDNDREISEWLKFSYGWVDIHDDALSRLSGNVPPTEGAGGSIPGTYDRPDSVGFLISNLGTVDDEGTTNGYEYAGGKHLNVAFDGDARFTTVDFDVDGEVWVNTLGVRTSYQFPVGLEAIVDGVFTRWFQKSPTVESVTINIDGGSSSVSTLQKYSKYTGKTPTKLSRLGLFRGVGIDPHATRLVTIESNLVSDPISAAEGSLYIEQDRANRRSTVAEWEMIDGVWIKTDGALEHVKRTESYLGLSNSEYELKNAYYPTLSSATVAGVAKYDSNEYWIDSLGNVYCKTDVDVTNTVPNVCFGKLTKPTGWEQYTEFKGLTVWEDSSNIYCASILYGVRDGNNNCRIAMAQLVTAADDSTSLAHINHSTLLDTSIDVAGLALGVSPVVGIGEYAHKNQRHLVVSLTRYNTTEDSSEYVLVSGTVVIDNSVPTFTFHTNHSQNTGIFVRDGIIWDAASDGNHLINGTWYYAVLAEENGRFEIRIYARTYTSDSAIGINKDMTRVLVLGPPAQPGEGRGLDLTVENSTTSGYSIASAHGITDWDHRNIPNRLTVLESQTATITNRIDAGGAGVALTAAEARAISREVTVDWAETSNTSLIPANKLTNAPGGTDQTARNAATAAQTTANTAQSTANTAQSTANTAQSTATTAQTTATAAQSTATTAQTTATAAQTTANSKLTQAQVDTRVEEGVADWAEDGDTTAIPTGKFGSERPELVFLTQAEYDALSTTEKGDTTKVYFVR